MVTCTECGSEIEVGTQYIAGRWINDFYDPHLDLSWACDHRPAEDAAVRLGSKTCVESFCEKHPECIDGIVALMATYESEHESNPQWVN